MDKEQIYGPLWITFTTRIGLNIIFFNDNPKKYLAFMELKEEYNLDLKRYRITGLNYRMSTSTGGLYAGISGIRQLFLQPQTFRVGC